MPDLNLSKQDLRILTHYASGTALTSIATIIGVDVEDVRTVVHEVAGFERKKAGTIVQQHDRRRRHAAASAEKSAQPAPTDDAPTKPAPELAPAPDPATEVVETPAPVADEPTRPAPEPEPAPVPVVNIQPRVDTSRSPVETVLARAAAAGGRYAKQSTKIRDQIVTLDAELAERERVADAEKRVEDLRAELAKATEDLRAAKRTSPRQGIASTSAIRAWAQENGINVNPLGVLPRHIVDQYLAAHPQQDVA